MSSAPWCSPKAGEKSVFEGNLDYVVFGDPAGGENPRGQLAPMMQIITGVSGDRGLPRDPRGGVNTHHIPQRKGEHAVRITLAQILLGGKRESIQILDGLNFIGKNL